jgi:two-component system cell cycle response regulator DivK
MDAPRVLVLDDDPDTRELYAEGLSFEGFRVKTASNDIAGMMQAQAFVGDVVVAELSGPTAEDLDIIRRIKAHDPTHAIQVIILTSWAIPTLRYQAESMGCDKPSGN